MNTMFKILVVVTSACFGAAHGIKKADKLDPNALWKHHPLNPDNMPKDNKG